MVYTESETGLRNARGGSQLSGASKGRVDMLVMVLQELFCVLMDIQCVWAMLRRL